MEKKKLKEVNIKEVISYSKQKDTPAVTIIDNIGEEELEMYYDFIKRPSGSITIYALTGYTDHRTINFYNILVYYKLKLMEVIMNKKIMRVILSRKGFDSGTGGWPSIILPELDNKMISFPIPDPDFRHLKTEKVYMI